MKTIVLPLALALASTAASAQSRPVVVELFTSQSCSSCPPADALLGELAKRADIVALGFHVTYWDGAAWRDPFARQEFTDRQYAYDRRLTAGQVYTPQMIVDGATDAIGSDRRAVLAALDAAKPAAAATVAFAADRRSVAIGAGDAAGGAIVLLARYVLARTTRVAGGENASRALTDSNAVVSLQTLGAWSGDAVTFPIEPPGDGEGIAVLVQGPSGRIFGAGSSETPATSPRPAPRA